MIPIPIVSLHSRKGGVGKTTLALWIAQEMAGDGHSLLIDADVVGTEVADLFSGSDGGVWPLGLCDLLTQSTGGNTAFAPWLETTLKDMASWKGMPSVKIGGAEIRILPSNRLRSATDRDQVLDELGHRYLVLDFAVEQLRRRLTSLLLAALKTEPYPKAIVIDNSPFHVGLARLVAEMTNVKPVAMKEEHEELLEKGKFHHLEVVGPDPQDVFVSLSGEVALRNKGKHFGWIFNRDEHVEVEPTGNKRHPLLNTEGCAILAALSSSGRCSDHLHSRRVAHVGWSGLLGRGIRSVYGKPEPGNTKFPPEQPLPDLLERSWRELDRFWRTAPSNTFEDLKSWSSFLLGTPAETSK